MPRINKIGIVITADAKGGVQALELTGAELKKLNATAKRTATESTSSFDKLKKSLFSLQGAFAAVGLAAGTSWIKSIVQATVETGRWADALGVPVEQLSALEIAAKDAGVTASKLADGLKDLAEKIADAYATGGGEAKDALELLGLSAEKLNRLNPADQLLAIADGLKSVQTRGEKIFILESLFNDATRLLPLLDGTNGALRDILQTTIARQPITTQEEVDAAIRLQRALDKIAVALDKVGRGIITAFEGSFLQELLDISQATEDFLNLTDQLVKGEIAWSDWYKAVADGQEKLYKQLTTTEQATKDSALGIKALGNEAASAAPKVNALANATANYEQSLRNQLAQLKLSKQEYALYSHDQRIWAEITKAMAAGQHDLAREWAEAHSRLKPVVLEINKATLASTKYTKSTIASTKAVKDQNKELEELKNNLQSLIDRLDPVGARTRAYIQDVELLNEAQRQGVTILGGYDAALQSLGDEFIKANEPIKEFVEKNEEEKDAMVLVWEQGVKRLDSIFVDMWAGAFDSFDSFADSLKRAFIQLLAELAHEAFTRQIVLNISGSLTGGGGVAGAVGNVLGGGGGSGIGFSGFGNILSIGNSLFGGGVTSSLLGGLGGSAGLGLGGGFLGTVTGGGTALATGGAATTGVLGAVGAALPIIGAVLGAGSLIASFFGDEEPDLGFNLLGELGNAQFTEYGDIDKANLDRIRDIINQADAALVAALSEAQILLANEYLATRQTGKLIVDDARSMAVLISNRYEHAFSLIDHEMSEAFERIGEQIFSGELSPEAALDVMTEMLSFWKIASAMSEELGVVISGIDVQRMIDAAGGLQSYVQNLALFADRFFSEAEKLQSLKSTLEAKFAEISGSLSDVVLTLPETRAAFRALVEGLDLATESGRILHGTLIGLVPVLDQYYTAVESTGTAAQSASTQLEDLARLMKGVDDQFAKLTLSDFQYELRTIDVWLRETTESARELGASTEQLARIQQVAALRTAQAIATLRSEIDTLIGTLYGVGTDAESSAIEDRIRIEQQRLRDLNSAARDLYNQEMARYRDAQAAIEKIDEFLKSMQVGSLSPFTPQQQLTSARQNFLGATGTGDTKNVIAFARTLLEQSRGFFGSSSGYDAEFALVRRELQAMVQRLGLITEPGAVDDLTTSELLAALEAERARLAEVKEQENRVKLARELAGKIGDLALATGEDVFELMRQLGVDLDDLARDFGINLDNLGIDDVIKIGELADLLGVSGTTLIAELGLALGDVATAFGLDITQLDLDLVQGLIDLGVALGDDFVTLATDLGLDLSKISGLLADLLFQNLPPDYDDILDIGQGEATRLLDAIRNATTPEELTTALNAFNSLISQLPGQTGIEGLLTQILGVDPEIEAIQDQFILQKMEQVRAEIEAIQDQLILAKIEQVRAAVEAIQDQLILQELRLITANTAGLSGGSSGGTTLEHVRREIEAIQDQAINLNLRAQNQNLGIPSYQLGTDYVPADMLARLHAGEMVIDARTAGAIRGGQSANDAVADKLDTLNAQIIELREDMSAQHTQAQRMRGNQLDAVNTSRDTTKRSINKLAETRKARSL